MTLYEKYKKLDIDFSQLSLEPGDTNGGYFCTPIGAEVIGWAGVDGIHCCFVKGFGEMVFAVNPENFGGEYVYPLAETFRDFLGLILAAGGTNPLQQIILFDEAAYENFVSSPDEVAYTQREEVQEVLTLLQRELGVETLAAPFPYVKRLQADFDYRKIPFSEEYFE